MPAETDDEALAIELLALESPDEADARVDTAYEAGCVVRTPGWARRGPVAVGTSERV